VVHGYCMMPNHLHLLLETKLANLSTFMKSFLGAYTMRFNKTHSRVGHLFQGRYKALLVDKDSYLWELSRYIHLNPCEGKLVLRARDYAWSSMRHYMGGQGPSFLRTGLILSRFASPQGYEYFVEEGPKKSSDPTREAIAGVFLGPPEFIERFRGSVGRQVARGSHGIVGARNALRMSADRLERALGSEDLEVKIYAYCKWGNWPQIEVARRLGKTETSVSRALRGLQERFSQDVVFRDRLGRLQERLARKEN
jgi:putative transposase